jgi:hypothetical protein
MCLYQTLWRLEIGSDANLALGLTYVAPKMTQNDVARNWLEYYDIQMYVSDSYPKSNFELNLKWHSDRGTRGSPNP